MLLLFVSYFNTEYLILYCDNCIGFTSNNKYTRLKLLHTFYRSLILMGQSKQKNLKIEIEDN